MKVAALVCWQGTDVHAALAQTLAKPPRRAGAFAELALLGAAQCAAGVTLPPETAVVLASRRGNRRQAEDLARQVALEHTAPMPFAFIASQSGAACQIVAAHLALRGPALCLSSTRAPFERALACAGTWLTHGDAPAALVGWVEEAQDATPAISHWLVLQTTVQPHPARLQLATAADAGQVEKLALAREIDIDTDAAQALGKTAGADEFMMAQRLLAHWRAGQPYRRVRTLENANYLVLTLTG